MKYKRIILLGFRCVGKTYIGELLSKKLGLGLVNMDSEIERREGKTIAEISENGKNWRRFREVELNVLRELLSKDGLIISAGGGVGVNDIILDDKKTFGDIEAEVLKQDRDTLKVLITTNEKIIKERLIKDELEKRGSRPALDSKITEASNRYDIDKVVEHNLNMFRKRKEAYQNLANVVIENNDEGFDVKSLIKELEIR